MNPVAYFVTVLVISAFYSVGVDVLLYAMPAGTAPVASVFQGPADAVNLEEIQSKVQEGISSQTNVPVIEASALVFYSGNLLLDLLLNFIMAVPLIISTILNGIAILINIPAHFILMLQIFSTVVMTVIYFIGLIVMLNNVRSGQTIT